MRAYLSFSCAHFQAVEAQLAAEVGALRANGLAAEAATAAGFIKSKTINSSIT
jgi:hypothetical protein